MLQGLHVQHSIHEQHCTMRLANNQLQQDCLMRGATMSSASIIADRQCMFPMQAAAEAVPQVPDGGICPAGQERCQQRHCGTHQAA